MSNFLPAPSLRTLFALGVCATLGSQVSLAADSLDEITASSRIRIGYANEAPFAYTGADGSVTGESPEVAKKIFERMNIKEVSSVLTEWGSLIPGLRAKRFDVIAAGMYITPERCKQVLFTDPHYQLPDALLTAAGNPKKLHSYEDIAASGAKLAIMAGTVELGYARQAGVDDAQILQVPDTTAQLQAVRAGRADAAVGTQLTMKGLAAKGGSSVEAVTDFTDKPEHIGYGALAFRPEDKALRDAVNAELKKWVGTEDHLATIKPFGFDQSNITNKTAAQICAQ